METTYKIELEFDVHKNVEVLVESFMTISSIFSKSLKSPFSITFPVIAEYYSWTKCINLELRSACPIIYEEYKSLSEALCKLSWACAIHDLETNIKTVIQKEIAPFDMEEDLLLTGYNNL